MLTITLSHDVDTLHDLRDEWINLQERSQARGVALTWHVMKIWWEHFGHLGTLWLLQARDENHRLIGLAPLMRFKYQPKYGFAWWRLAFIGAIHNHEHLDFIIETGYETNVLTLFIDTLMQHNKSWDELHLSALSETPTLNYLQQFGENWIENLESQMISPYIPLPQDTDSWLQSLSRNRRWKLRRYPRQLDEEYPNNWSVERITTAENLDAVFDELVVLHQTKWEALGEAGALATPELIAYFRDIIHCFFEQGWLRLYQLMVDGKTAVVLFAYHYRGRTYNEIVGFDDDVTALPVGHVMTYHSIDEAIQEGASEYTMMWGEEEYKYSFGGQNRVQYAYDLVISPRVAWQKRSIDILRTQKQRLRRSKDA